MFLNRAKVGVGVLSLPVGVWGCGGGGGLKGGVRAVRCYLYVGACPPTYIHKVISHHVDACI